MVIYPYNKSEPCFWKKIQDPGQVFRKIFQSVKTADSYVKISLLKAIHKFDNLSIISVHIFDIICLSETYVDPSVLLHDVNLEKQDYELVQSGLPS